MDQAPTTRQRGRRRLTTLLLVTLAGSFLTGFAAESAAAGDAISANGYFTVNGHQYRNQARIITNTGSHSATAYTYNQWSTGIATAGWAGARGRLFIPTEVLWCEGTNTYNTGAQATGISCTPTSTISAWFSYGVSLGWNGSGYNSAYTFKSPSQNS